MNDKVMHFYQNAPVSYLREKLITSNIVRPLKQFSFNNLDQTSWVQKLEDFDRPIAKTDFLWVLSGTRTEDGSVKLQFQ